MPTYHYLEAGVECQLTYHCLEARVECNKEWWLVVESQDTLFNHSTFDVVVLNNDLLFEDLDGVQFIGSFTFS